MTVPSRTDEYSRLVGAGVNRRTARVLAAELGRSRHPSGRRRYPREHGSERGYRQHQQIYRDPPCVPCRAAHAFYTDEHCRRTG